MSFSASINDLVERSGSPLVASSPLWPRIPLGQVATILNGAPWKSDYFNDQSGVPLIRIRDVTTGTTNTFYSGPIDDAYWVEPGDILVGMDGDFNLRVWDSCRGLLNQRVCKITPDEQHILRGYLAYVLPGYLNLINDETHSVTVKHLSSKTISEIPIPLPPITEQQRMVARLDGLRIHPGRARSELGHIPKLIERYKQAILAKAFSGELTTDWRRTSKPEEIRIEADCEIGVTQPPHLSLERPWTWLRAEALCRWITKGTTPPRDGWTAQKDGVPFIKVYNLTFDTSLDFSIDPSFVNRTLHETVLRRSTVYAGDVLMNIVGPPLGKVSIVPSTIPEANVNQAIAIFRPTSTLDPEFLAYWLLSEAYLDWALTRSKATAGQRNLTLEICRDSPVPVTSIDEQREIVRIIRSAFTWLDKIATEHARAEHLLPKLDQAILAKAFRGELVPQDPNDEPASELLERIKADGAGADQPRRRRASA